jgi:hypothetical protein
MCESGRALDWLLREGTYAIVVLRSINLAAGPAQVASEIAALPPIEPIARPAVHAFFGPNRSFVGSEPVEFPSLDFAASDACADAGGLSVLSGIHARGRVPLLSSPKERVGVVRTIPIAAAARYRPNIDASLLDWGSAVQA